jgi:hypothetical protein
MTAIDGALSSSLLQIQQCGTHTGRNSTCWRRFFGCVEPNSLLATLCSLQQKAMHRRDGVDAMHS